MQWYTEDRPEAKIVGKNEHSIRPGGARRDPINNRQNTIGGTTGVSELVGGCIFTMDCITFGLEVCRDHYLKRLASSQNSRSAQIQLIPSAGMSIEQASIACADGGIIFNVDGVSPHAMVAVNSQIIPAPKGIATVPFAGGGIVMFDRQTSLGPSSSGQMSPKSSKWIAASSPEFPRNPVKTA